MSTITVPMPFMRSVEKESVLREMVFYGKDQGVSPQKREGIIRSLLKREELGSTGIGKGVAVPHTKYDIKKPFSVLAVSHDGIDFNSLDGDLVYIVWLLVSTNDSGLFHCECLEAISRHIRNEVFRRFLKESSSEKQILDILYKMEDGRL